MSPFRLEIRNFIKDTRALVRKKKLQKDGFKVEEVQITDVYTVAREFPEEERLKIGEMLVNPIFEKYTINTPNIDFEFDYAIETRIPSWGYG